MLRVCELFPAMTLADVMELERGDQVTLMAYAFVRAHERAPAVRLENPAPEPKPTEDQDGAPPA